MAPIELKLNSCWAMHGSGVYFASDMDIPQHASWGLDMLAFVGFMSFSP